MNKKNIEGDSENVGKNCIIKKETSIKSCSISCELHINVSMITQSSLGESSLEIVPHYISEMNCVCY
jgi:bifunctional N-acetylglucosamine-1-phosphate-uridyltransferase/glucosamine-1-phosphate-acetyltransferase GlmU-like protein